MKVTVEINQEEVEGDRGHYDGLRLTCSRCGHEVQVGGTTDRSAMRGAIMLRDECPNGEDNYYDVSDWL